MTPAASLMMRCITAITITQRPDPDNTGRNLVLNFDFVHEFEAEQTWMNLTNKAKIVVPKNIYVTDQNGDPLSLYGTQAGTGNLDNSRWLNNLFRKGDSVSINYGYYFYDEKGNETRSLELNDQPPYVPQPVFNGFISQVESKMPVTLHCEDNMWLLKQIPCPNMVWSKTKTLEQLMQLLLQDYIAGPNYVAGNPLFTINALTETYIGDLQIQNMSVAQLLEYLRRHFHIEAYFLGNEFFIGSLVYVTDTSTAPVNAFIFQQNIISSELTYMRKDDVNLSAVCESLNTVFTGHTNKQGQKKTKQDRLTVLVYYDANGDPQFLTKKKNVDLPANLEGERRKLFFPNITDAKTLADAGFAELKKYYYEGFRGSFTTFACPRVRQGDTIFIKDIVLPDRSGFYVVKGVKYTGGVNGHRQIITLDYKQIVVGGAFSLPPGPVPENG